MQEIIIRAAVLVMGVCIGLTVFMQLRYDLAGLPGHKKLALTFAYTAGAAATIIILWFIWAISQ